MGHDAGNAVQAVSFETGRRRELCELPRPQPAGDDPVAWDRSVLAGLRIRIQRLPEKEFLSGFGQPPTQAQLNQLQQQLLAFSTCTCAHTGSRTSPTPTAAGFHKSN